MISFKILFLDIIPVLTTLLRLYQRNSDLPIPPHKKFYNIECRNYTNSLAFFKLLFGLQPRWPKFGTRANTMQGLKSLYDPVLNVAMLWPVELEAKSSRRLKARKLQSRYSSTLQPLVFKRFFPRSENIAPIFFFIPSLIFQ